MDQCHLLPGVDKQGMIKMPLLCCNCKQKLEHPHYLDKCRSCGHSVRDSLIQSQIPLDENKRFKEDVTCIQCQYNLRSIGYQGHCPECGCDIEPSIMGHMLHWHQNKWLNQIRKGFGLMISATYLLPASILSADYWPIFLTWLIAISAWSIWSLTRPNSTLDQTSKQLRFLKTLRIYGLGMIGLGLFSILIHRTGITTYILPKYWLILALIGSVLVYLLLLLYMIRSEQLIVFIKPDIKQGNFRLLKWGLLLTFVMTETYSVLFLAPLNISHQRISALTSFYVIILIIMYVSTLAMIYTGQKLYAERLDVCRSLVKPQTQTS